MIETIEENLARAEAALKNELLLRDPLQPGMRAVYNARTKVEEALLWYRHALDKIDKGDMDIT